jgi:hypothetical protein
MKFLILPKASVFSEQDEHDYILRYMFDAALETRDEHEKERATSQFTQSPAQGGEEEGEADGTVSRAVVLLDGANPQVKWLKADATRTRYAEASVSALKSPASTTSHLAANDVMKGHGNYRTRAHSTAERESSCPPEGEWPQWVKKIAVRLLRYAATMKSESRDLIIKHL